MMNRFSLDLSFQPLTSGEDSPLAIDSENLHPSIRSRKLGHCKVTLVGNPIVGSCRDDERVFNCFKTCDGDWAQFARALNGSFLVIVEDLVTRRVIVINDRFASLAIYWSWVNGRFDASSSFKGLMQRQGTKGVRINAEEIFTFLAMRRLFAESTFVDGIQYLRSASLLEVDSNGARISTYWHPDFHATPPPDRSLPNTIAERLRAAVAMHMSDDRKFGLLLSGGLDSRALLAASPRPPVCFTTCLAENNESAVAAEVARRAGAEFHFIPRPVDLYDTVLDDASFLAGMQIYAEAQFMGYGEYIGGRANTLMIGLGLDVFFGGLYLPKSPVRILGREGFHHCLKPLPADIAGFYIDNVKYRLKTSDPFSVVRPEIRSRMKDALRHRIETVLKRGQDLGARGYQLWEYLHFHNFSRHYSFPMMASIRTFADCRAPALENDLFDLALAMTPRSRLDGTAYQDAITLLAPALMAVRNANTNFPAAWSLRRQTVAKVGNRFGQLVGAKVIRSPAWRDRSWPLPRASLDACPTLRDRARHLPNSRLLGQTELIDPVRLARVLDEHRLGSSDHTVLINLLLTLDSVFNVQGND